MPMKLIYAMLNRLDPTMREDSEKNLNILLNQFKESIQQLGDVLTTEKIHPLVANLKPFLNDLSRKAAVENPKIVVDSILTQIQQMYSLNPIKKLPETFEAEEQLDAIRSYTNTSIEYNTIRQQFFEAKTLNDEIDREKKAAIEKNNNFEMQRSKSKNIPKIEKRLTTISMDMISFIDHLNQEIHQKYLTETKDPRFKMQDSE